MKEAIEKAVEGGYMLPEAVKFAGANNGRMVENGPATLDGWSVWELPSGSSFTQSHYQTFLDPLFWQSLGKAMGWDGCEMYSFETGKLYEDEKWALEMHRFIDYLIAGKDADSFFADLLKA